MTIILWLIIAGILLERMLKYWVKKTPANTSLAKRRVTSVKDLWKWRDEE